MSMLGAVYAIAWQQRAARGIEAAIMCRRKVRRGLRQEPRPHLVRQPVRARCGAVCGSTAALGKRSARRYP